MLLTVFTPAYNRGHLLPKLFESLARQTFKGFEWLIVDDGSEDNTQDVISGLIAKNDCKFPVRYYRQQNGGKHRAINRGVREADGEMFLILDSDDTLPDSSLETIAYYYNQIREDNTFGGVCGYMAHHDGTVIGRGNDDKVLDTDSISLRYKYNVEGDMCEVFRTSVLKEYMFPEIDGERFCPEALVWNRIAQKYKLRVFRDIIYYRDYLEGGLTDKIVRIRMKSPTASMMTYAELIKGNIPFIYKIKAAINYWRFRLCAKTGAKPAMSWKYLWTMPMGFLLHMNDLRKV